MNRASVVTALTLMILLPGCTTSVCDTTGLLCSTDEAEYTANFETDSVLLRLSDLPAGYNTSGSTMNVTANMSGKNKDHYQNQDILKYHSRSFQLANSSERGEKPLVIISSITIYESKQASTIGIEKETQELSDSGAHVTTEQVVSGINATEVKFRNDRGIKTVMLYDQRSNLKINMIVSGVENYHDTLSKNLLVKIYSRISK